MSSAAHDAPAPDPTDALPAPFRWALAFRGSPVWLAAGAGLLYFAVGVATVRPEPSPVDAWSHAIYALYFAWVPLALVVLVRGTGRDAADLAPALGAEADSLRRLALSAGTRAIPWGLALGLLIAGFDLLAIRSSGILRLESHAILAFVAAREVIVCLPVFAVLGWAAGAARALSRQAREHARPDLLDASPLAPLARCGTRMLLFWVLIISLTFPYLVLPGRSVAADVLLPVIVLSLFLLALAGATVAIPTWGARHAIRAAKRAELDRVHEQIGDAREARDDPRLPGLLAWEARIEAVAEWPIDARSLRLTGLYVMIPVVGWIGGAVVERVVDAALG